MDWIVPVSPAERAGQALSADTTRAARAALAQYGCLILKSVFETAFVDALMEQFVARYGAQDPAEMSRRARQPAPNPVLEVGERRFEIAVQMSGRFAAPQLFANPLLCGLLQPILGQDMRLSGFTAVVSYPGAAQQHVHQDHPLLFTEPGMSASLPAYAINVAVPLVDVDAQTGPTGLWPGSHLWPPALPSPDTVTMVPFQRGDCILLDYRTIHTGLPNRGTRARPILYMVYARTWFFDELNHVGRTSLDMSLEQFDTFPEPTKHLLMRVFSQAMRARQMQPASRA